MFFFSGLIFVSNATDNQNDQKKEEMLDLTLEWGRLAPLPDSAEQFEISTEGSSFTRSFRSSFYADKNDLDGWVKSSPGLQDAQIETTGNTKEYIIDPGGGAAYAEATIDFEKCFVEIYVYWS
jgi:hypothetical protein